MKPKFGDRVKHKDYEWEGTVNGFWEHPYSGLLISVRLDDPGLDDDFFIADRLEVIETSWCRCGHDLDAHFDGVMKYQACFNEWCRCHKWKKREV